MPRTLTERERETLEMLLSLDMPGVAELRKQAPTARVTGKCPCGCATIDLEVDRHATPPSTIGRTHGPAIEAVTRPLAMPACASPTGADQSGDVRYKVVLWVDEGGWLSGIEIIDFILDDPADANPFPPPEDFYPPRLFEVLPPPRRRRRFHPGRR